MPTAAYRQREELFYKSIESLKEVVRHPDFEAPDHPHVRLFPGMVDYATMGVVDMGNGIVHTGDTPAHNGVTIVPLVQADLGNGRRVRSIDFANNLCRNGQSSPNHGLTHMARIQAQCAPYDELLNPVILLHPNLIARSTIQLGATMAHELDHVHRIRNRHRFFRHGNYGTPTAMTQLEISAYRLERQVLLANDPETYALELAGIVRHHRHRDFESSYTPRGSDRYRRNVRATAFVNFMFDCIGAEVHKRPTPRVIRAMQRQGLIS